MNRIRLTDGLNPHVGRVEVYTNNIGGLDNGEWGTVCGDSWDIQDARVVCRQLGYPDAIAALSSAHYSQGSGPVWFGVQCLGNELDLFECTHSGIAYHSCNDDNDASVECLGILHICMHNKDIGSTHINNVI